MMMQGTEEQRSIQAIARNYARQSLMPKAALRDQESIFPNEEIKELGSLGFLGVTVDEQYGGSQAGTIAYAMIMRELGYADLSVSITVSVINMVAETIQKVGSEQQKKTYLPTLCQGGYGPASFALSEPDVGSDINGVTTSATKTSKGYCLNGTKQWVTSGNHAGLFIVFAKTETTKTQHDLSAFLIEGRPEGLSVASVEDKMGLRGSNTVQLVFDNVIIPEQSLLGKEGDGFKVAMIALEGGRLSIASQALGVSYAAIDTACDYAKQRKQFQKLIASHQAVGNMLADAVTWAKASEMLVMRAASYKERGISCVKEISIAKLFATEKAQRICDIALQVHGGYGYTKEFPVERLYRDVRVMTIFEGSSEIQRKIISSHINKEAELSMR